MTNLGRIRQHPGVPIPDSRVESRADGPTLYSAHAVGRGPLFPLRTVTVGVTVA